MAYYIYNLIKRKDGITYHRRGDITKEIKTFQKTTNSLLLLQKQYKRILEARVNV